MVKTILVALDETHRAAGVLRVATEFAERFDADVILLRALVIDPLFPAAAATTTRDPLPGWLTREARAALLLLAQGNPRALKHDPIVEIGQPFDVILAVAEHVDADLIALGSHGVVGLDRLFGTVTGKVATRARRHVLVVHE